MGITGELLIKLLPFQIGTSRHWSCFPAVILTSLNLLSSDHVRKHCKYCKSKYWNVANL